MMTPAKPVMAQARGGCETCSDEDRALSCACFLFLIFVLGVRHNTTLVVIRLATGDECYYVAAGSPPRRCLKCFSAVIMMPGKNS